MTPHRARGCILGELCAKAMDDTKDLDERIHKAVRDVESDVTALAG